MMGVGVCVRGRGGERTREGFKKRNHGMKGTENKAKNPKTRSSSWFLFRCLLPCDSYGDLFIFVTVVHEENRFVYCLLAVGKKQY